MRVMEKRRDGQTFVAVLKRKSVEVHFVLLKNRPTTFLAAMDDVGCGA